MACKDCNHRSKRNTSRVKSSSGLGHNTGLAGGKLRELNSTRFSQEACFTAAEWEKTAVANQGSSLTVWADPVE